MGKEINMRKKIFLWVILNGIALDSFAQVKPYSISSCDSIEIESVWPERMTIMDICDECYEKISESNKKKIVLHDSKLIKVITDSINSIITINKTDGIDIRGKISCYLPHGEKVVLYIGQWSMQFNNDIYMAPYYLFELLYIPFKEDNKGIGE